jgi:threonine/homoserine/homoserine lactone efflux protein
MGALIGSLLPLAVGVAISPVPIIAVILMLLSKRAGSTSVGFLIGWLLGIVLATVIFWLISRAADLSNDDGEPSTTQAWIQLVLGVLLLLLGVMQWRKRPKAGEVATMPKWMASIEDFTFVKALGLAFLLSAVNPKNLMMFVGAGVALGTATGSTGTAIVALLVFTLLAGSTVLVPVVGYLSAKDRVKPWLEDLRVWLTANNAAVMSVLLVVLGVSQLGKGLGGL